ncbi:DUF6191 domain-containing protein [uncultured Jatrophihabitans sp.]|uniref:DUF6191 domain-containing protein n=1 Tax=uncultured Jatrophihabitans sp. TaxID=1610747 RepID=UPI0035CBCDA4
MTQWGLDTIFNPAKRHMDEEKRRLQSTREEVGDNSGGRRIDLESGKVRIAAGADDSDEDSDATAVGDADEQDAGSTTRRGPKVQRHRTGEPTPAQIRAAARRGRKLD